MTTPPRMQIQKSTFEGRIRQQKWLTLVALPILMISTYFGYYSVWGALFIFWGLSSTLSGEVFLLEPINRGANPVLFWIISVMWIGFGALYILADFFPEYLV